ncbi:MAG: cohesin domain-containing protein [Bacillota bacterium]|nr:cohesin domain-containing protein [Bacillota bacterium]
MIKALSTPRIVPTVLVIVFCYLVLFMYPGSAVAADLNLSVDEKESEPGEQVTLPVRIENASGTEGGQFILTYDPAVLDPVSLEAGDLVKNATGSLHMANLDYEPGKLMFMWVTAAGDAADAGILCTVTFSVLKAGQTEIAFRDVVIAPEGAVTVRTTPGGVSSGDVEVKPEGTDETENERKENKEKTVTEDEQTVEENQSPSAEEELEDEGSEEIDPEEVEKAEEEAQNYTAVIVIVALAILLPAGFAVYKRLRKNRIPG